jgi:hypothetical protein
LIVNAVRFRLGRFRSELIFFAPALFAASQSADLVALHLI